MHKEIWRVLKYLGEHRRLYIWSRLWACPGKTLEGPNLSCLLDLEALCKWVQFSSVQFSRSVMSDSLRPHESQHARPPCPSPTPGVHSNSYPSSQWCHPAISSCHPLLFLLPIPPTIRVFSNESTLHTRWPRYWSVSFNISPSSEHPGLISFSMEWLDLLEVQGLSRVFSNTTVQKHQYFGAQLSSQSNSHIHTWPLEKP